MNDPKATSVASSQIKNQKNKALTIFLLLLGAFSFGTGYCDQQETEKENKILRAKTLYGQYKLATAELTEAAATGDPESQFFLAEELRQTSRYMTTEAVEWYERAADQGDMYAMYRLATAAADICHYLGNCPEKIKGPEAQRANFIKYAKVKAKQGDSTAMLILYYITGLLSWLEKSAAAGNPEAPWLLANRYQEGHGLLWPAHRKKKATSLLHQSAQGGHAKGMLEYAGLMIEKGNSKEATYWLLKGVEISYAHAIGTYAKELQDPTVFEVEKNPVKAYALFSLLLVLDGGGRLDEYARYDMTKLEKTLTPAQIREALILSTEWKKNHKPVSFYRTKLGL